MWILHAVNSTRRPVAVLGPCQGADVNGQVEVPAGGQVKVPFLAVVRVSCGGLLGVDGTRACPVADMRVARDHLRAGRAGSDGHRARRRLATWLHKFVFSGVQDYFEIAVDQYADVPGAAGVAEYRRPLDWTAEAIGEEAFAVRYARGRIAVLDRDPDAIVAAVGQGLTMQYQAVAVVEALDDAGLHDLAVEHAALGLRLPHSHQAGELVQRLVDDATARGDTVGVLELRRAAFTRDPSSTTLTAYRTAAEATGAWADEARAAEDALARTRPWEWVGVLIHAQRDEEAWTFAVEHPDAARGQWERLCARRAETAPAETVPHYRRMITEALATTGRASYLAAARLLVRLRAVCVITGTTAEFVEFMATTVETNRRRPTCIDELVRAGLIRRDRSVI